MFILFDRGVPRGVSRVLRTHTVATAKARGWERPGNGALLTAAENAGFDVLFTTDNNLAYQQNLTGRKIAIVVLTGTTKWSRVRLHLERRRHPCSDAGQLRPGQGPGQRGRSPDNGL
jgi:hypothetical protein